MTLKTVFPKRICLKWFVLAVGLLGAGLGLVGMRFVRQDRPLNSSLSRQGSVQSDRIGLPWMGVIRDQETSYLQRGEPGRRIVEAKASVTTALG
jgi:hypothetical protein